MASYVACLHDTAVKMLDARWKRWKLSKLTEFLVPHMQEVLSVLRNLVLQTLVGTFPMSACKVRPNAWVAGKRAPRRFGNRTQ